MVILSFYKLDVQVTVTHKLDTWMFICVFPIFLILEKTNKKKNYENGELHMKR